MAWRYVEIKGLHGAKKDEKVCAVYPNSYKNVSGSKTDEKMKKAAEDAKKGKCKLVVWRNCEEAEEKPKVKNVIKGHLSHEDIERITIIDTTKLTAIYAGKTENWINVRDCMKEYKSEVENMEVIKSEVNCGCQLFVFV